MKNRLLLIKMARLFVNALLLTVVLGNRAPSYVGAQLRSYLLRGDKSDALKFIQTHQLTANTIVNSRGENILHLLASVVHNIDEREFLQEIVDQDTSLDEINEDGMTALHLAAIYRRFWMVDFLLVNGARATIQNNVGKTASDYARQEFEAAAGERDANAREIFRILQMYDGVERRMDQETQPLTRNTDSDKKPTVSKIVGNRPDFLIDLNDLARAGKIDTVIGRNEEIRQLAEILGRRQKNNPILVGDAGVGKTAIVEGLAELIVRGEISESLQDKVIYNLDLTQLNANTEMRGEFEKRIVDLLKFMEDNANAVLFVDEAHMLANSRDGVSIGNILKPALARGQLRLIAATTDEEYQRHILNDKALTRRLVKVEIAEPSLTESAEILLALRAKLSDHHTVEISDSAIWAAVTMSARYLQEKKLPDKAIDIIDEAASALRLTRETIPRDLQKLEDQIKDLEIRTRLEDNDGHLEQELEQSYEQLAIAKDNWQKKRNEFRELQRIDKEIELRSQEIDSYQGQSNFSEARRLKYQVLPALKAERASYSDEQILSRADIAAVIARRSGIPQEKILQDRQQQILELLPYLRSRIYGQDQQLEKIADRLVTAFAGLTASNRPLASFILKGPSGSGKTETAKALAQFLFAGDNDENLIRLDLSEYREPHSIARLIGAPPGYVGYEEGGALTGAVRRRPHSVILFDEIEKAHPEFANIMLQILDDGRLSDRHGTVDFKNTVVIMTSNSPELEQSFRPEFLGRIDNILTYNSLDRQVMDRLIDQRLTELNDRLSAKQMTVKLSPALRELLAEQGYSEQFGARPLATLFEEMVSRPLAYKLVGENESSGGYLVDVDDSGTTIVKEL